MNKVISIIAAAVLLLSLCACGNNSTKENATASPEQTATADESAAPEESTTPEPGSVADIASKTDAGLNEVIIGISNSFEIGTAGSSLQASRFAAQIMDWCTKQDIPEEKITATAKNFYDALSDEKATAFKDQLDALYNAGIELCGSDGADILASAGYTAQTYPWTEDQVDTIFKAIYDGIGAEMPEQGTETSTDGAAGTDVSAQPTEGTAAAAASDDATAESTSAQ